MWAGRVIGLFRGPILQIRSLVVIAPFAADGGFVSITETLIEVVESFRTSTCAL